MYAKFRSRGLYAWFLSLLCNQTDRHTDTLIATLRTPLLARPAAVGVSVSELPRETRSSSLQIAVISSWSTLPTADHCTTTVFIMTGASRCNEQRQRNAVKTRRKKKMKATQRDRRQVNEQKVPEYELESHKTPKSVS